MNLNKEILPPNSKVLYFFKFILLTAFFSYALNLVWMSIFGMFWVIGVSNIYLVLFFIGIVLVAGLITYFLLKKPNRNH